jgi:hypothetical protein
MPFLLADISAAAADATTVHGNPLAILTFIAAPAVLTNATSLLALGTSQRFARNVDRSRVIIKLLEGPTLSPSDAEMYRRLLGWLERRMQMLMGAMSMLYFAIGCFAAGCLTSLLGAIVAPTNHPYLLTVILAIALLAGVIGLGCLVYGGVLLVRETRLALATIREEMRHFRARHEPLAGSN